jgi:hypothetical protein
MVPCDNHVALRHISEHLGISSGHVHHIVIQVIGYQKGSAMQVSKCLNDEHKATYMGVFLEHLLMYERGGDKCWDGIVRGASCNGCSIIWGLNT